MSIRIEKFPWRRDEKLFSEAENLVLGNKGRFYENWSIFAFGMQFGELVNHDFENFNLVFRAPTEYPDAILVNEKTKEVLNVEFEEHSSDFREQKHDPKKCDLIVCQKHDWKECPIDVYEMSEWKLHKAKR